MTSCGISSTARRIRSITRRFSSRCGQAAGPSQDVARHQPIFRITKGLDRSERIPGRSLIDSRSPSASNSRRARVRDLEDFVKLGAGAIAFELAEHVFEHARQQVVQVEGVNVLDDELVLEVSPSAAIVQEVIVPMHRDVIEPDLTPH